MIPLLTIAVMLTGVDHILLGVPDLASARKSFEARTGVAPVYGGRHPGRATENALVSLGHGVYLELIAPQPQPDAQNDLTAQLQALKQPELIGWAAHTDDIAALRARLVTAGFKAGELSPGARITPAGTRLEWTTLDAELANAPFFIQWGSASPHPSATSPSGCVIKSFELQDPQPEAMKRLLSAAGVSAPVKQAKDAKLRLVLQCGERTVTFD